MAEKEDKERPEGKEEAKKTRKKRFGLGKKPKDKKKGLTEKQKAKLEKKMEKMKKKIAKTEKKAEDIPVPETIEVICSGCYDSFGFQTKKIPEIRKEFEEAEMLEKEFEELKEGEEEEKKEEKKKPKIKCPLCDHEGLLPEDKFFRQVAYALKDCKNKAKWAMTGVALFLIGVFLFMFIYRARTPVNFTVLQEDLSNEEKTAVKVINTFGFPRRKEHMKPEEYAGTIRIGMENIKYKTLTPTQFMSLLREEPMNHKAETRVWDADWLFWNDFIFISIGVVVCLGLGLTIVFGFMYDRSRIEVYF